MACPRWRTLQELGRSGVERGVGEEDVVPHAFVLVEERKLGSGVGAFPADDDASVGRIAGKVGHAGQFRDLGGLARSPSWPSSIFATLTMLGLRGPWVVRGSIRR